MIHNESHSANNHYRWDRLFENPTKFYFPSHRLIVVSATENRIRVGELAGTGTGVESQRVVVVNTLDLVKETDQVSVGPLILSIC